MFSHDGFGSICRAFPSNMIMKTIPKIAALTFMVICILSGCRSAPNGTGYHVPTHLINQIASTDHIIITNRFADREPRYRGFNFTVSGDEASKIVHAVSSAQHCAPTDSIFNWDLQFYRGTHLLADIHLQGSHFVFEGEEYFDGRVLERLYHDLLKRTGHEF